MTDRFARALGLAALALSQVSLSFLLLSRAPWSSGSAPHALGDKGGSGGQAALAPRHGHSAGVFPAENSLSEPRSLVGMERLERLEAAVTTAIEAQKRTEKTFYFDVDPSSPDDEEEYYDDQTKERMTYRYALVPLNRLGYSASEVVEVQYLAGDHWVVCYPASWEVQLGVLRIVLGSLITNPTRMKIVYR